MPNLIELNRQFSLFFPKSNNPETNWELLWSGLESSFTVGWDEILEHDHAIILSEAGTMSFN